MTDQRAPTPQIEPGLSYMLRPSRSQLALIAMILGMIGAVAWVNLRTGSIVTDHTGALNDQLELVSGNVASLQREVLDYSISVLEYADGALSVREIELSRDQLERQMQITANEALDNEQFNLRLASVQASLETLNSIVAEGPLSQGSPEQAELNRAVDDLVGEVMRLFDLTESENFSLVHRLENTLDMWRQVQWIAALLTAVLVVMLVVSVRRMLAANYADAKSLLEVESQRYEQIRAASERLESRYREVVDEVGEVVWRCDGHGRFSLLNRAWGQLTGDMQRSALGRPVLDSFHPDDRPQIEHTMWRAMSSDNTHVLDKVRLLKTDGGELTVTVSARSSVGEAGVRYVVGTIRDVSATVRAEGLGRIQNEVLAMIVSAIPLDQVLAHIEASITQFAEGCEFGFVTSRKQVNPESTATVDLSDELSDEGFFALEWHVPEGVTPVEDLNDLAEIGGRLGVMALERHQNAAKLYHDATHDGLTGLLNRTAFIDRLEAALDRAEAGEAERPAVLLVDLDRFKVVNESLGHSAGDRLIGAVARRLGARLRATDTVARLGGDEFVILVEETDRDAVERVANRILEALAHPIQLGVATARVTASVGAALGEAGSSQEDLLKWADIAMYQAKSEGGGRWVLFDAELRDWTAKRNDIEVALQGAGDRGELELWFQPLVSLVESTPAVGFEGLVRWRRPGVGLVPPGDFIGVAEESDLVLEIGEWVLNEGISRLAKWQKLAPDVGLSLNVSGRELIDDTFAQRVKGLLEGAGAVPSGLTLEVTEGVLIEDADAVSQRLSELQALGVSVAIDDFGTGYSSLRYLRHLPVDVLKIDRAFVSAGGGQDLTDPTIVASVTKLGHELGLRVLAEGVETKTQLDALRQLGVDRGQGYLFSKPIEVEAAERILTGGMEISKGAAAVEAAAET